MNNIKNQRVSIYSQCLSLVNQSCQKNFGFRLGSPVVLVRISSLSFFKASFTLFSPVLSSTYSSSSLVVPISAVILVVHSVTQTRRIASPTPVTGFKAISMGCQIYHQGILFAGVLFHQNLISVPGYLLLLPLLAVVMVRVESFLG